MTEPTVLAGGQGETFMIGPNTVRVLTDAGDYGIAEGEFAPKAPGPPRHIHAWEEAFYVLEGKLEVTTGAEVVIAWPGDYVMVPGGVPHTFAVHGAEPARFVAFFGSGRGLAYIREIAAAPTADGVPDSGAVAAIHDRYGVRVV